MGSQEPLLATVKPQQLVWFSHVVPHDTSLKMIFPGFVEGIWLPWRSGPAVDWGTFSHDPMTSPDGVNVEWWGLLCDKGRNISAGVRPFNTRTCTMCHIDRGAKSQGCLFSVTCLCSLWSADITSVILSKLWPYIPFRRLNFPRYSYMAGAISSFNLSQSLPSILSQHTSAVPAKT